MHKLLCVNRAECGLTFTASSQLIKESFSRRRWSGLKSSGHSGKHFSRWSPQVAAVRDFCRPARQAWLACSVRSLWLKRFTCTASTTNAQNWILPSGWNLFFIPTQQRKPKRKMSSSLTPGGDMRLLCESIWLPFRLTYYIIAAERHLKQQKDGSASSLFSSPTQCEMYLW